jgi:hypothetical protein
MQNSFSNFTLLLVNTRKHQYLMLGIFIVVLNAAMLFYAALFMNQPRIIAILVVGIALPLAFLKTIKSFTKKKQASTEDKIDIFLLATTMAWLIDGFYWFFAAMFVLHILFKLSIRTLKVVITADGIRYPSLPAKTIHWSQIDNLIVKDDLLTIDIKTNKLIQQPIEQNSFTDARELQAFNTYCQQQIKAA